MPNQSIRTPLQQLPNSRPYTIHYEYWLIHRIGNVNHRIGTFDTLAKAKTALAHIRIINQSGNYSIGEFQGFDDLPTQAEANQ